MFKKWKSRKQLQDCIDGLTGDVALSDTALTVLVDFLHTVLNQSPLWSETDLRRAVYAALHSAEVCYGDQLPCPYNDSHSYPVGVPT